MILWAWVLPSSLEEKRSTHLSYRSAAFIFMLPEQRRDEGLKDLLRHCERLPGEVLTPLLFQKLP